MRTPRWIRLARLKLSKRPKDKRKFAELRVRFQLVDGDPVRTRDNALRATDDAIDMVMSGSDPMAIRLTK
jgi:hypothetical protein